MKLEAKRTRRKRAQEKKELLDAGYVPQRGRPSKRKKIDSREEGNPKEPMEEPPKETKEPPKEEEHDKGKGRKAKAKAKSKVDNKADQKRQAGQAEHSRKKRSTEEKFRTPLKLSRFALSVASPKSDTATHGSPVDKAPQQTAAQLKRAQKAKLGLNKLMNNLGTIPLGEMCCPGPGFDKLSYTCPGSLTGCNIGVLLYTETFYVIKNAALPTELGEIAGLQAWALHVAKSFMAKKTFISLIGLSSNHSLQRWTRKEAVPSIGTGSQRCWMRALSQ